MTRPLLRPLSELTSIASGNSIPVAIKAQRYTGLSAGTPYIGTKEVGFDSQIDYESGVSIPDDEINNFRIATPGTVLVCSEGGSAGRKVGLVDRTVCYGNKLFAISPSPQLDPEYLFYFCRSAPFRAQFKRLLTGIIGGVSKKKFETIEIPVVPLSRQRKIAERAAAFEVQHELLRQVQLERSGAARELMLALLETSIGQYVSDVGDPESEDALGSRLETLSEAVPTGWSLRTLRQLSRKITDGVHHTPTYVDAGIPFVTVKNLTAGPGISFDELKYITPEAHEEYARRANPERGDILITKDGTIGVVRLIETDLTFSIFVSVAMIQLLDKKLSPYVYFALQSPSVQRQITPKGAALKHLYLEDLRNIVIPVPPESERMTICGKLTAQEAAVHELEAINEQYGMRLEELWDAVLGQEFSIELLAIRELAA